MQIIFGKELAQELRTRHFLLELETFDSPGRGMVTAYCVVPGEVLQIEELMDIDRLSRIHQATVDALNRGDTQTVIEGITHLRGRFGGELDSFYDIILDRFTGDHANG